MSRGKWYRFRPGLVVVSVFLLFAAACGDDDVPEPGDTQAPVATEAAAPDTTEAMAEAPAMVDDEPIKLGYISGGDADPFVFIVTESIRDAAAAAGVELFECDANFSTDTAIQCARTLDAQGLDAVINWQFFPDAAEAVCEAYGDLPTVTMDVPQGPCERVFVGSNGYEAGLVAGAGLGDFAQSEFGCDFDLYVSIENLS